MAPDGSGSPLHDLLRRLEFHLSPAVPPRGADFHVVLGELLPHSRERVQIGNSSGPDARVSGPGTADGSRLAHVLPIRNRGVTCLGTRACVSRGTPGTLPSHRPSRRGGSAIPARGQTLRTSASRVPPPRIA